MKLPGFMPLNRLARVVWTAVFVLQLVVFVVGIAGYFASLQQVCAEAALTCQQRLQMTPVNVQELQAMGWSLRGYAWYTLLTRMAMKVIGMAVGLLIFWRKPDDRMAWVASAYLIVGSETSVAESLATLQPTWWLATRFLGFWGVCGYMLFFYLFPNGRFVPRWTAWLSFVWAFWNAGIWFFPGTALASNHYGSWNIVFAIGFFGSLLAAPIYRYWRVSNTAERQQIKWVILAIVIGLVAILGALALVLANGGERRIDATYFWADWGFSALNYLLPLSIGIAILRQRLWDIDVIIRKTVQYTILTLLLGLIYFGIIIALQTLLGRAVGEQSPLVIVFSTLLIAALFNPLRRRVQAFIDRRFFRKKYDAAQVLTDFAQVARDETNMEVLTADLLHVIQETLQPGTVILWLKPTADRPQMSEHSYLSSGKEK